MYVFKALLYFKSPLTFNILISTFHIVFSSAWKLIICRSQKAFLRERFISSHDIGCIFSYKLRYFRQTCGAYMVNTDLLPAAPQIAILSSFFLAGLPDSKSQLMEQIVLSIMMFCLGGSHQSLKIFFLIWKKFYKSKRNSALSSRPGMP